jgi:hypothetical protein
MTRLIVRRRSIAPLLAGTVAAQACGLMAATTARPTAAPLAPSIQCPFAFSLSNLQPHVLASAAVYCAAPPVQLGASTIGFAPAVRRAALCAVQVRSSCSVETPYGIGGNGSMNAVWRSNSRCAAASPNSGAQSIGLHSGWAACSACHRVRPWPGSTVTVPASRDELILAGYATAQFWS